MDKYEKALAELGLAFPEPNVPVANYVSYVIVDKLVYISGQVPMRDRKVGFVGKLGKDFTTEQGQEAARVCALQVLALIRHACGGDLDRVARCVRLGGFVNSTPEFTD